MAKQVDNRSRQSGVKVRSTAELAADLAAITEYRKKGYGWRTIAGLINRANGRELNFQVYYNQYHDAISPVEKEAMANKDELILAELSEIDWQIDELQTAWSNSKGLQTKSTVGDKGNTSTEWTEHGDPRYMAEITKLRERRAKLLGLDSPDKHEHSGEIKIPAFTWGTKSE